MAGDTAARYERLATQRQFYLDEAKASAELTIPSLMPDAVDVKNRPSQPVTLPKPWQSLGARGVRNLTSKLVLSLLPSTGSFFRWEMNPELLAEIEDEEEAKAVKTDIEQQLAQRERIAMQEVETQGLRAKADQAFRHLVVCGNVLLYLPPTGGMRVFPLNSYVLRRDFVGNVVEIIFLEVLDRQTVPPAIAGALAKADAENGTTENPDTKDTDPAKSEDKPVYLHTHVRREGKRYKVSQEVDGQTVEGTQFTVAVDKSPFIALRFVTVDGEDYGRGYIEEFRGDLQALEDLQRSIVIASLNAAKLHPIVNPNSTITPRKLIRARNGEPLVGLPDDVKMLQQEKYADMRTAQQTRTDLVQALSASFLLNSSFQRKGERVTAEEIRRMAEELEDALGGVFSVLSQEFQLPLALRLDAQLVSRGAVKALPAEAVKPAVVTGLAAIGRGHELQRLRQGLTMVGEAAAVLPTIGQRLNDEDVLKRIFVGVGIDTDGLFKSDEDLQAEQQAAQQQELVGAAAAGAAPSVGKAVGEAVAGGASAPPGPTSQ
jgi:hypothetical protein